MKEKQKDRRAAFTQWRDIGPIEFYRNLLSIEEVALAGQRTEYKLIHNHQHIVLQLQVAAEVVKV